MYLLTKSETLNTGVTVTFTSGTDTGNIIDGDLTTNAETANRSPNLTINLGVRKVIDALWLNGENLQDYDLQASNNNITYTDYSHRRNGCQRTQQLPHIPKTQPPIATGGWHFPTRCIRSELPGGRGVSDVSLARPKHRREASTPLPDRLSRATGLWRMRPTIRTLCSTTPKAMEKTTLTFQWEHLDNDVADALEGPLERGHPTPQSSRSIHGLTLNPTRST